MAKFLGCIGWFLALSGIVWMASSVAVVLVEELPVRELGSAARIAFPLAVVGLVLVVLSELLLRRRS